MERNRYDIAHGIIEILDVYADGERIGPERYDLVYDILSYVLIERDGTPRTFLEQ